MQTDDWLPPFALLHSLPEQLDSYITQAWQDPPGGRAVWFTAFPPLLNPAPGWWLNFYGKRFGVWWQANEGSWSPTQLRVKFPVSGTWTAFRYQRNTPYLYNATGGTLQSFEEPLPYP